MRLKEIDFLRGIAVIMVVLFHYDAVPYFQITGWAGVDLFFVLSGYLVSNLVFAEYQTHGSFRPVRFLVRRAWRIYPLFYAFLLLTAVCLVARGLPVSARMFAFEATFTRNFFGGIWVHTWTLCIEEHFYFLLAILFFFGGSMSVGNRRRMNMFLITIFASCLVLRLLNYCLEQAGASDRYFSDWSRRVHTFYALDGLALGVWVAYHIRFNAEWLKKRFQPRARQLLFASVACIVFLPLLLDFLFFKVFLYSILATCNSILLIYLLLHENALRFLNRTFSSPLVSCVAQVGLISYPLYLFHVMVRDFLLPALPITHGVLHFTVYLVVSVATSAIAYQLIERRFNRLRDRYIPSRST